MIEFKWYDVNYMMPNCPYDIKCLIVVDAKEVGEPEGIYPAVWDHKEQRFKATDSYDLCFHAEPVFTSEIEKCHNVIAWAHYPSYSRSDRRRYCSRYS